MAEKTSPAWPVRFVHPDYCDHDKTSCPGCDQRTVAEREAATAAQANGTAEASVKPT